MGAGIVTARGENHSFFGDFCQRARRGCHAGDCRRIVRRPNDNKIVVHDVEAFGAIPGVDEILLILFGMNEQDIAVAVAGVSDGLACPDGDHVYADFRFPLEFRQDAAIEPGICRRGCRLQNNRTVLRPGVET